MKKILIIYPSMMVGGSTTSLLSILNEIQYTEYSVDLLLLSQKGKLYNLIPKEVNILPFAMPNSEGIKFKLKKMLSVQSLLNLIRGKYYDSISDNSNIRSQIMQSDTLRFCKMLNQTYDVAISFLEGWPLYYLTEKVISKKKIAWLHVDYLEAGLKPEIDKKFLNKVDRIVLVSDFCKEHFDKLFPEFNKKSIVIENILSQKVICKRAEEHIEYKLPQYECKELRFVSTCRIVFYHKGIDRALKAFSDIKKTGHLPQKFAWYIIGDGQDSDSLIKLVNEYELNDYIFPCGEHTNPLPLVKMCEVFFLPSRYEGKPIAVTEAQMLGLLPIVTKYSSANEQISSGVNGLIIENNDESLKKFLVNIFDNKIDLQPYTDNVSKYDYSNPEEFAKVIDLIEE